MKHNFKNTVQKSISRASKYLIGLGLVLVAAVTSTVAISQSSPNLTVRLSAANAIVKGDVDVAVNVHVTNNGRSAVRVPKWQMPSNNHEGPNFHVTRDGTLVEYVGRIVKRGAPTEKDFETIPAGATVSYQVELTGAYDLSQNGRYSVEFVGLDSYKSSVNSLAASAAPLYLWLEGRTATAPSRAAMEPSAVALAGSITYTGGCTTSQKTSLNSAVTAARNYAQSSYTYLSGTPSATLRYKTWFGTYSLTNWNTVKGHFSKELDAFSNKPLTLDCSCKDSYYAYVYPNAPYKIYVCNAFWTAPMTGTDSKGGTLVHEMSHFTVVAGTSDYAYGQSAAKSLAISNVSKALMNADTHEYFAENNPFQN